jgi:hypothetical protein
MGLLSAGGIVSRTDTSLDHVIVAGNKGSGGSACDLSGPVKVHNSLIGTNANTFLAEAPIDSPDANGNFVGGPIHGVIDPKLGPLADNGGLTLTHLPLAGSPVIDAGDPALEPGVGDTPEFDQRGAPYARIFGGRIDIGAYEHQEAAGAFIADFNGDGFSDGADFLMWQRNVGNPDAEFSQGDATGNGLTDANDLAVWRNRFPEPPFLALEKLTLLPLDTNVTDAAIASKRRVESAPDDEVLFASFPAPRTQFAADRRAEFEITDASKQRSSDSRDSAFEEYSRIDSRELDLSAWN